MEVHTRPKSKPIGATPTKIHREVLVPWLPKAPKVYLQFDPTQGIWQLLPYRACD